jgi:hypothetical protein
MSLHNILKVFIGRAQFDAGLLRKGTAILNEGNTAEFNYMKTVVSKERRSHVSSLTSSTDDKQFEKENNKHNVICMRRRGTAVPKDGNYIFDYCSCLFHSGFESEMSSQKRKRGHEISDGDGDAAAAFSDAVTVADDIDVDFPSSADAAAFDAALLQMRMPTSPMAVEKTSPPTSSTTSSNRPSSSPSFSSASSSLTSSLLPASVSVMSWNVNGVDTRFLEQRVAAVAAEIAANSFPDVVCLQEVTTTALKLLCDADVVKDGYTAVTSHPADGAFGGGEGKGSGGVNGGSSGGDSGGSGDAASVGVNIVVAAGAVSLSYFNVTLFDKRRFRLETSPR